MEFIYKAAPLGDIIADFDEKNGIVKVMAHTLIIKTATKILLEKEHIKKLFKKMALGLSIYINTI